MAEQVEEQVEEDQFFCFQCDNCRIAFIEGTCRINVAQHEIVPDSIQLQSDEFLMVNARMCRACKSCDVCMACMAAEPHMACPACGAPEEQLVPLKLETRLTDTFLEDSDDDEN